MTSKEVFTEYAHLLGIQIDRLKQEYYENRSFDPNCSVCRDEASCQEKVAVGSNETASSPRAAVSPRLELHTSPFESGQAPRHFDGTTHGPTAKKALSLEQSHSVSTPCKDSSVFHKLACESKELPFETYKDPNGGQSSFMKQNEADMATGFFIDTGLNSDSQKYRIRKDSGHEVDSSNDVSEGHSIDTTYSPRILDISQPPRTPDRKPSPRSPVLGASPRLSLTPRTPDLATPPCTPLRSPRESALGKMRTLTGLRNDRLTEWNRDVKWLCEDVQDYTLASVDITERQKILDSLRTRFSRLSKGLNILTHCSKQIGATRYRHEHSDEDSAADLSPRIAYSTKYRNVQIDEPMDDCLTTVDKVKDGIESLRQKLESKCDGPSEKNLGIIHRDYTGEIDAKASDGYCPKGDNTGTCYDKLALDVDSMVKDVQRLKENQEYKFPDDKSNMSTNISPRQDILQYNVASSDRKENTLLATALDRLAKLDAGEYAKEIQHHNTETTGDVSNDEMEFSEFVRKETQKKTKYLEGNNQNVCNGKITAFPTLASTGHFFSVLLIAVLFIVFLVKSLTPRVCDRSFAHQMAPHVHFIELTWSDGIPPV